MGLFDFLKRNRSKRRYAIIDVGDSDFKHQVIQRSYKMPVVVDYWASWCVPCRQLGPVLERIAEEPESEFILAKLNTEHNKRTAGRYNIRSIPAVKAFRSGQVVREFTGVLPEALVRRFIANVVSGPPPRPRIKGSPKPAQRLSQAKQHLMKGRGFEAFVLLNDFPSSPQAENAARLLPLARFIFDIDDGDGWTGVEELDDQFGKAVGAVKRGKPAKALDHLFGALDAGEAIDREYTAGVIGGLFALLGDDNRLTRQYRPKLESHLS